MLENLIRYFSCPKRNIKHQQLQIGKVKHLETLRINPYQLGANRLNLYNHYKFLVHFFLLKLLCDGPATLRLCKNHVRLSSNNKINSKTKYLSIFLSLLCDRFDPQRRNFMKKEKVTY